MNQQEIDDAKRLFRDTYDDDKMMNLGTIGLRLACSLEQANAEITAMQKRLDEFLEVKPREPEYTLEERVRPLSPKETQVCRGLVNGDSYQRIADEMGISINTVRHHIRNAYKKLGVNSAVKAAFAFEKVRGLDGV